jgi:hypothetical protein
MSRAVLAPFEAYQKSRVTFVQTVAELAQRPQNIEALQSAGKYHFPQALSSLIISDLKLLMNAFLKTDSFRCYGPPETPASR